MQAFLFFYKSDVLFYNFSFERADEGVFDLAQCKPKKK